MKRRRDPFARESYIPERMSASPCTSCAFCGQHDPRCAHTTTVAVHRIYRVRVEPDSGRDYLAAHGNGFCSWSCAEAYTGARFAR